jgi:RNA polymerase sigma-70 factor (ECF subfamily)
MPNDPATPTSPPVHGRPDARTQREFEELFASVAADAYGVALRLTRNAADAEDLVQESALRAYRGFAGFERGTNFRAWLLRIITNGYFERYRLERRRPMQVDLEDAPDLYLYGRFADAGLDTRGTNPAEVLFEKLDTEQVMMAIDALPDEYRVAATLYFMQDLSYEEIAQVLDVPIGTVRSRLHRGRKLLQKALWQVALDHGLVGERQGDQ